MNQRDDMDCAEMREELAMNLQWATDYSIESCRREIDRLTDGQAFAEWEQMQQYGLSLAAYNKLHTTTRTSI